MSTHTTALNIESIDRAADLVVQPRRSRSVVSGRLRSRLHSVTTILAALMVTPFAVLVLSALVFMFLSKLLIEFVAAGFER